MDSIEIDVQPVGAPPTLVVVGVPTFGMVSILWHAHMSRLQCMNIQTHEIAHVGAEVGAARNSIVESALRYERKGHKASHVFFVDDDVLIPPHALLSLLAHERPIVSGLYYAKTPAPQPLVINEAFHGVDRSWKEGDFVECAAHGMGCTLIAREVFETIEPPWFQTVNEQDGPTKYHGTEDMYFCHKAREAGYQPAVDTSIFCPHWHAEERRWYPLHKFEEAQAVVA